MNMQVVEPAEEREVIEKEEVGREMIGNRNFAKKRGGGAKERKRGGGEGGEGGRKKERERERERERECVCVFQR